MDEKALMRNGADGSERSRWIAAKWIVTFNLPQPLTTKAVKKSLPGRRGCLFLEFKCYIYARYLALLKSVI